MRIIHLFTYNASKWEEEEEEEERQVRKSLVLHTLQRSASTCLRIVARVVQFARKQLQADDCVNDDDEYDEQCDVQ